MLQYVIYVRTKSLLNERVFDNRKELIFMAKQRQQSIIGVVGGLILGAAMLLYVGTMILGNLKDVANDDDMNDSIDQLQTMLGIVTLLLAITGIVIVGWFIVGIISGGGVGGQIS